MYVCIRKSVCFCYCCCNLFFLSNEQSIFGNDIVSLYIVHIGYLYCTWGGGKEESDWKTAFSFSLFLFLFFLASMYSISLAAEIEPNPVRFSQASLQTEDSFDSTSLATPLDASPLPPPSNTFSLINIVNNDPLPNPKEYHAIASTYTRRRAQTASLPVQSMLQRYPIADQSSNPTDNPSTATTMNSNGKRNRLWPKLKRMMMPKVLEKIDSKPDATDKGNQDQAKRWLSRNRVRVGPPSTP
ncbi:hypothetical protein BD560DRAFT_394689 [Blakeslea trispora]|nr:hypothetical protein BD560DRAFT_394689 [Blakeslea trispora]